MLYDGLTIYPSSIIDEREDNSPIASVIMHTSDDEYLFSLIDKIKTDNISKTIYVIFPYGKTFNKELLKKYPFVNFCVFEKEFNRVNMFVSVSLEIKEDLLLFLDSSYSLTSFDRQKTLRMFEKNDNLLSVSPFVYSNVDVLFPTLMLPKITNGNRVDTVSIVPECDTSNTLYPFLLLGIYRKSLFVEHSTIDYKIKSLDWIAYDCFSRLHLCGFDSYVSSVLKLKSNIEFIPIIDRTYNKDAHIVSSKLLSFVKAKGGKASLKAFWWINFNIVYVVKSVRPFLNKAVMDFYTLVKEWQIERDDIL